ncbi:hypothetical protein RRG08_019024 [Elysia crispata]|uniref:Uncharacterized protein n=1 Tax=Elysia crispata TaxID=231223 RepID=A0AAE1A5M8_9GAST|nr:hypothetical protein RRG08_019024 [Elysia crispata]
MPKKKYQNCNYPLNRDNLLRKSPILTTLLSHQGDRISGLEFWSAPTEQSGRWTVINKYSIETVSEVCLMRPVGKMTDTGNPHSSTPHPLQLVPHLVAEVSLLPISPSPTYYFRLPVLQYCIVCQNNARGSPVARQLR